MVAPWTDYYQVLGIPRHSDEKEVKKAWRRQTLKCHPDKGGSNERFHTLQSAHETLSDPSRRRMYDSSYDREKNRQQAQESAEKKPAGRADHDRQRAGCDSQRHEQDRKRQTDQEQEQESARRNKQKQQAGQDWWEHVKRERQRQQHEQQRRAEQEREKKAQEEYIRQARKNFEEAARKHEQARREREAWQEELRRQGRDKEERERREKLERQRREQRREQEKRESVGCALLLIGAVDPVSFRIPETTLIARAHYWVDALDRASRDPAQHGMRVLPFQDLDPSFVDIWYRGVQHGEMISPPAGPHERFAWFAELYVVGERFHDTRYTAEVMTQLRLVFDMFPDFLPQNDPIHAIYKATKSGSPARKLLIEYVMKRWTGDIAENWDERTHPRFLAELLSAYARERLEQSKVHARNQPSMASGASGHFMFG